MVSDVSNMGIFKKISCFSKFPQHLLPFNNYIARQELTQNNNFNGNRKHNKVNRKYALLIDLTMSMVHALIRKEI